MASTIKIKRSALTTAPTFDAASGTGKVAAGEMAWVHNAGAGSLYVGSATGSAVEVIGGKPGSAYCASIFAGTPLTGTTTAAALDATGAITCVGFTPTGAVNLTGGTTTVAAPSGNSDAATKLYVDTEVANAAPDMDAISDTDIGTGIGGSHAVPAAGHVLVYDGTNSWDNRPISGDVTLAADGTSSVTSVANGAVAMATDTDGNFVSAVTAVLGQTVVNLSAGAGNAGDSVAVGLATDVTIPNDLTIGGNLIVSGDTTTVNTSTVTLEDPVFKIGSGTAGKDRGVEFAYHDGSNPALGFFGMDDSDDKFKYITAGTNTNETYSGTAGGAVFGTIEGTTITGTSVVATSLTGELQTASQPNVTTMMALTEAANLETIGTITTGVWNGDEIAQIYGGTGRTTATANNDLLIGNAGGAMTVLGIGAADTFLHVNAAGNALEYTDTMDGGSF